MKYHCEKWGEISYKSWLLSTQELRKIIEEKRGIFISHMKDSFNMTKEEQEKYLKWNMFYAQTLAFSEKMVYNVHRNLIGGKYYEWLFETDRSNPYWYVELSLQVPLPSYRYRSKGRLVGRPFSWGIT